jgi:hypothetical protein
MPSARLAPGPRGMMPADDLDRNVELSSASGVSLLHDVKFTAGEPAEFRCSLLWTYQVSGGARRDRTDDLKLAKLALSQLSYGPLSAFGLSPRGHLPRHFYLLEDPPSGGPGKI